MDEINELHEQLIQTMEERNEAMDKYKCELREHIVTLKKLSAMYKFVDLLREHVPDQFVSALLEQSGYTKLLTSED